ncbi:hypothetical protein O151_gp059 [Staphylococcus phage vB_SauM_Remus]|uniref:Uncharacterized protein n=2 Tax=Silviavirus remus TaxID=1857890 RepID=S4T900_9CAUD|nr:hypothetical protein O151_gp059 [Staphylococcus phage vB_SauM_Remus]AFV81010.1 hypothetical protein Remus_131 [Staphylococcus phage vB_SauM_Remus]QVD58622.1 hypothetical protein PM93_195 [Staphylococcus phage PM93]QVD58825.1 hypothetical protein Remus_194 [Silviavirus remus]
MFSKRKEIKEYKKQGYSVDYMGGFLGLFGLGDVLYYVETNKKYLKSISVGKDDNQYVYDFNGYEYLSRHKLNIKEEELMSKAIAQLSIKGLKNFNGVKHIWDVGFLEQSFNIHRKDIDTVKLKLSFDEEGNLYYELELGWINIYKEYTGVKDFLNTVDNYLNFFYKDIVTSGLELKQVLYNTFMGGDYEFVVSPYNVVVYREVELIDIKKFYSDTYGIYSYGYGTNVHKPLQTIKYYLEYPMNEV